MEHQKVIDLNLILYTKQDFSKLLPSLFLGLVVTLSVLINLFSDYMFGYKGYAGFLLALIAVGLFFVSVIPKKVYIIFTLITILLGVCSVIKFSIYNLIFTLNSFSIQIIPAVTLFIFLYVMWDEKKCRKGSRIFCY